MNGLRVITPILMSHAPLDTVTIMLGTNDSKERFGCNSYLISQGIVRLVKKPCTPNAGATTPGRTCSSSFRRPSRRSTTT